MCRKSEINFALAKFLAVTKIKCIATLEKKLGMTGNLWYHGGVTNCTHNEIQKHCPQNKFELLVADMQDHLNHNPLFCDHNLEDEITVLCCHINMYINNCACIQLQF